MRLWIAQGFGVGRIPAAPGTFGSALGVLWFLLLVAAGSPWLVLGGTLAGFAASVWLCGYGEKVLGQKDPGSVVLDEVTAMPVCYGLWFGLVLTKNGAAPSPFYFVSGQHVLLTLAIFGAFRLFDILKPWPVRESQALPGGWGITVDDFLAAAYVNGVVVAVYWVKPALLL